MLYSLLYHHFPDWFNDADILMEVNEFEAGNATEFMDAFEEALYDGIELEFETQGALVVRHFRAYADA